MEVPALILGGPVTPGGPRIPLGGVPLEENQTFHNLIGDQHRQIIEALYRERQAVAASFGIRDFPALDDALWQAAGATDGDGRRPIPTTPEATKLVSEAITGSLVPLTALAQGLG